jgi:hypothetical protein
MRTSNLAHLWCALAVALSSSWRIETTAYGQNAGQLDIAPAGDQQQPQLNAVLDGIGLGPALQGGNPNGGGAASADFDSLIDLIISTVEHDTWQENGTGEGQIMPFDMNGVYVDADRAIKLKGSKDSAENRGLTHVRLRGARTSGVTASASAQGEARTPSPLRYVSLPRLEAAIALQQQRGVPLEPAMLTLAGLERVSYVLIYPETGDLVLAGPAGDWRPGPAGSIVSAETGRPILRLDDLAALWRRRLHANGAPFGCSIIPRQEALARTQQFLREFATESIEPGERRQWLEELRGTLGVQDVAYYNVDPATRIARLLLAADYHMKLVGMGLADGVPGVESYLETIRLQADGTPPAMSVLRWWFSMPEVAVETTADRDAFVLPERCIEVLSENELLAAQGKRIHTGQSDEQNERFARSFTRHFTELAEKYPVYGELARLFELSLVLTVIEREGLAEQVGWTPSLLVDDQRLRLPAAAPLPAVDTVVNHRVIGGKHIIAGISGGVSIDVNKSLSVVPVSSTHAAKLKSAAKSPATILRDAGAAAPQIVWWWD